jgi:hypothetical protein
LEWQLYILFWDKENQLLFINNSSNSGFFEKLAQSVAGEVQLISGPNVFRCLSKVNRLLFQNVGLLEQLGRLIRYTMRAGSDVESGLSEAQKQKAIKSNLFGTGYEDGNRTSIGCSYKGRIWSRQHTDLRSWTRWCRSVGSKLLDESLDPEEILKGTLVQEVISERPMVMPIRVDWPDVIYRDSERDISLNLSGQVVFLHEVDISINDPSETGTIKVVVSSERARVVLGLYLFEAGGIRNFRFDELTTGESYVNYRGRRVALVDFFYEDPPTIWFANGSSLRGNELVQLREGPEPFPRSRIETWDWTGVNFRRESQGVKKQCDSIQYRVIQELLHQPYAVVFDDDDSGEAADVVAVREGDTTVVVEFYHCKFSKEDQAGSRIADLYELCGQAQKSVRWLEKPVGLFTHLMTRESSAKNQGRTRFELGGTADLFRIREKSRQMSVNLSVFIVQPGLSKARASRSQLELLSVTENYLMETFKVPFGVIASG